MNLLQTLGVYGWNEADETLALASLLTGDPLLLIGKRGAAKTHAALKLGQALGRNTLVYDASKAMFEDVLGYPNLESLKNGAVEYVPSPVTIWDKQFVVIDELNRALPELQSKWLEIIRSRRIMGFPTQVRWVWAAMNPAGYAGAQPLDEALAGRFALFLYPPDVLRMDEQDRIRVATLLNGDDAPALREWLPQGNGKTHILQQTEQAGERIRALLQRAAQHFMRLRNELSTLAEFLARFASLAARETQGEIDLDGRRLGFMHRNLLAARAVEYAKAEQLGRDLPDWPQSARRVILASIPIGLNDASINREEALHQLEACFDLLGRYFEPGAPLEQTQRIYELFTTSDLLRKAQILLGQDIGELAACKAWNDLAESQEDVALLAYTALQVEALRPGTVPHELLGRLSARLGGEQLNTDKLPALRGEAVEYIEEIEALFEQPGDLERLAAFACIRRLAQQPRLTREDVEAARQAIQRDAQALRRLIGEAARAPEVKP